MSRTKHQRKTARKFSNHLRKNKEWGSDSSWKLSERKDVSIISRQERRSPRKRLKK